MKVTVLSARAFENLVRRGGYGFYLFPKNGRYQDLGTRILVPVPGSWYQDLCTKIQRSRYQHPSTQIIVSLKVASPPWKVLGDLRSKNAKVVAPPGQTRGDLNMTKIL